MKRNLRHMMEAFLRDESGQAFTEWVLIATSVTIALALAFNEFNRGLGGYYRNIVRWVTLPIP